MRCKSPNLYPKLFFLWAVIGFNYCLAQQTKQVVLDTNAATRKQLITSYLVPSAMVLYGFLAPGINAFNRIDKNTNAELREDHPAFSTPIDNYFRYVPAITVYGMDVFGLKAKHNLIDRSMMLLIAGAITSSSVTLSKSNINRIRPNGSIHSFPSSHTAMAFMTAEFMHQEYQDDYPLISYLGYATATATGVLRLYNGAHWVSDVVAGAGYGIIATKLSYVFYPALKHVIFHEKPVPLVLMPIRQHGYSGFILIYNM